MHHLVRRGAVAHIVLATFVSHLLENLELQTAEWRASFAMVERLLLVVLAAVDLQVWH